MELHSNINEKHGLRSRWDGIFTCQVTLTVNEPANRYVKPILCQHEFSGCHKFRLTGEKNIDVALAVHLRFLEIIFQPIRHPSAGPLLSHQQSQTLFVQNRVSNLIHGFKQVVSPEKSHVNGDTG